MKPILFSTPMVQAILAGTKTQTRRIMKPQPEFYGMAAGECYYNYDGVTFVNKPGVKPLCVNRDVINYKAKYQPGDVLWVRETFLVEILDNVSHYVYKSDYSDTFSNDACWKPSIFMPREAARLFLRVTDVRAERVQDISEEDAIAEGVQFINEEFGYYGYGTFQGIGPMKLSAKESYETLWDKINGPGSWDKNPWVFVYTFERIEKPE